MLDDLVWDVQSHLHGEESRVCSRGQFPELKVICDVANVSSCSIGSLISNCVEIVRESLDETSLSRFTRDLDSAKPESTKTNNEALYKRTENQTYCRVISTILDSP